MNKLDNRSQRCYNVAHNGCSYFDLPQITPLAYRPGAIRYYIASVQACLDRNSSRSSAFIMACCLGKEILRCLDMVYFGLSR